MKEPRPKIFSKKSLDSLSNKIKLQEILRRCSIPHSDSCHYTCPFCDSICKFMASSKSGRFLCLECGVHGNAIQFVMAYKKLLFADALEWLSKTFDIPLVEAKDDEPPTQEDKKELFESLIKMAAAENIYLHTNEIGK